MSRTIYKYFFIIMLLFTCASHVSSGAETRQPLDKLFNHKKHKITMSNTGVTCADCHTFAVKSSAFEPTSPNVAAGFLAPNKRVCHECHLGKVEVARVNQCALCHLNPEKLAPDSHRNNWKSRHGQFAQMNPAACNDCHKDNQNSCSNCHTQKNALKPMVHRPNFRLTHSVQARANPAQCVSCHASTNFCLDCHTKGISR